MAYNKNYLTYPLKVMNITQSYNGTYSHINHVKGTLKDYPIDEGGKDSGRDWFYCPCDEMVVAKIRYVGESPANQIWLQSTGKVEMPCGNDYVSIMVLHSEDSDLKRLKEGQKFKRGEAIIQEGRDGYTTGNHFHISVARGKTTARKPNNLGAWTIYPNAILPEDAFYIDYNFTTIKNGRGIKWVKLPEYTSAREKVKDVLGLTEAEMKYLDGYSNASALFEKIAKGI